MKNRFTKTGLAILLVLSFALGLTVTALAVSGAAFTTFNAHADGSSKDVCKTPPSTVTFMAQRNTSG